MGQDTAGRLPSRRVLDELRTYLPLADRAATPVARAFVALDAAVMIHAEALARVDWAESRFLAVRSRLGAIEDPGGSRDGSEAEITAHAARSGRERVLAYRPPGSFVPAASDLCAAPSP